MPRRYVPTPKAKDLPTQQVQGQLESLEREIKANEKGFSPRNTALRGRQLLSFNKDFADADIGDTLIRYVAFMPSPMRIVAAHVLPDDALTANDTDYAEVIVLRSQIGTESAMLCRGYTKTKASNGTGNWVAGVPVPLTLLGHARCRRGDVLAVYIAKIGRGIVTPRLFVQLHYQWEE